MTPDAPLRRLVDAATLTWATGDFVECRICRLVANPEEHLSFCPVPAAQAALAQPAPPAEEPLPDHAAYEDAVEQLAILWGHSMSASEAGAFDFAWDRQRERHAPASAVAAISEEGIAEAIAACDDTLLADGERTVYHKMARAVLALLRPTP